MSCLKPIASFSLQEIVAKFGCKAINLNANTIIQSANTIEAAGDGDVCFLSNTKYIKFLQSTQASACIVDSDLAEAFTKEYSSFKTTLLVCKNPYLIFSQIVSDIYGGSLEEYEIRK